MSNEVKIGILAIVTIAVSFWGYKFIMGQNALASSNIYYVEYENVEGLQKATPVRISGYDVGVVADIYLKPDDPDRNVIVMLDLRKDIKIPKDTKATIVATGFMGGKAILLEYDKPCFDDDCAESGAYLQGSAKGLFGSMVGEENMKEYVDIIKNGLQDVIDTLNKELLSEDSDSPVAKSAKDLQATMANLESTTAQLDNLLRRSSGNIEGTLKNLDAITGTLKDNNDKIKNILTNAETLTGDLAQADIKKTLQEVSDAIKDLSKTLQTADGAIAGVSTTLDKINNGEGTIGKLMQDEALYNELKTMSASIDSLVSDIQERPYRYMPLKGRNQINRYDRKDERQGN